MSKPLDIDDYEDLEHVEWVRLRPNVYLGPTTDESKEETVVIVNEGKLQFKRKRIRTSHANLQTFREAISNANDNVRRYGNNKTSCIVRFEEVEGENPIIEIVNGGHAPPIDRKSEKDLYVPHRIFGKLLSGSNFKENSDDDPLGGTNGVGIKATNIFSSFFEVSILNSVSKKKWFQRFEEFEPVLFDDEPYKITDWNGTASKVSIRYQLNNCLGKTNLNLYAMDVISASITSMGNLTFYFNDEKFHLKDMKLTDWFSFYPPVETEKENPPIEPETKEGQEGTVKDEIKEEALEEAEEETSEGKDPSEAEEGIPEEPGYTQVKKRKRAKKVKLSMKISSVKTEYLGPPLPKPLLSWRDKYGNEVVVADIHRDFGFPHVQGFVNGLPCSRGVHIKQAQQIFAKAFEEQIFNDKDLKPKLEKFRNTKFPSLIKENVFFLVKAELPGKPEWGSGQIKDELMGCKVGKVDLSLFDPSDKVNVNGKEEPKWGDWKNSRLMQVIINSWESETLKEFKKTDGKKTKHVSTKNYEGANLAGTKDSEKCTLILCEGESAAGYIRQYISLFPRGKDFFGVFAFKGKPLNVMKAYLEDIIKNEEYAGLKKAGGLQFGMDYRIPENKKTLRYGKWLIAVDPDVDGSHIRAIIMAYCRVYIQGCFEDGFVSSYYTPLIRAQWQKRDYTFYRTETFQKWMNEDHSRKGVVAKYFKGLGTSGNDDIKSDRDANMIIVHRFDTESEDMFDLALNNGRADDRKRWIAEDLLEVEELKPGDQLVKEFLNGELITFYHYSVHRAISTLESGFKVVQGQLLWALRNNKEFKKLHVMVAKMIETTKYHHGDMSASKALIQMTRDFTMSNNVPYFTKNGQFGTRAKGGKDASAPRYIEAKISPIVEKIYPSVDYPLLTMKFEEGDEVEPAFFLPIIPMALVNGVEGIAVGWSSFIPSYDPIAVVENVRRLITGKKYIKMTPWYRGYNGLIKMSEDETYFTSSGSLSCKGRKIYINELPLFYWTHKFRKLLEKLVALKKIQDFSDNSKPETVDFEIKGINALNRENFESDEEWEDELHHFFGLQRQHSLASMVLLVNGKPKRYQTVEEIIVDFIEFRKPFYEKRIGNRVASITANILKTEQAILFLELINEKKVLIDDPDLVKKVLKIEKKLDAETIEETIEKYSIRHLRPDGLDKLKKKYQTLLDELEGVKSQNPITLWLNDLSALEKDLKKM